MHPVEEELIFWKCSCSVYFSAALSHDEMQTQKMHNFQIQYKFATAG